MITLLLHVHTTYMCAILCPHPIRGEPCIQHHAKKWQQNHSLQKVCTNWIFAGEGSTKADVSFAVIIYITVHWYRRLRRNNHYSPYQHGRQMDFSIQWPKKLFQGASSGEISFHQLKLRERHFLTKNLMNKHQITTSTGLMDCEHEKRGAAIAILLF